MQNRKLSQSQMIERIESAWHMAELCGWEHSQLLDYLKRTLWDELATRAPAGARRYTYTQSAYASGYAHAMHNRAMREKVEFCYLAPDGVIYSAHRESTHRTTEEFYKSDRGHLLGGYPSAHVWKGSDRPFSTGGFQVSRGA